MENVQLTAINAAFAANKATIDLKDLVRINGGLSEGFVGKVSGFGYVETSIPLSNDQVITIAGQEFKILKGEKAMSLSLQFEGGTNVAVRTLCASLKSTIGSEQARSFLASPSKFEALIGKTISVPAVIVDKSLDRQEIIQVNGENTPRTRSTKAYTLVVA